MSSMLYLDYARTEGDWIPNKYGGNENLEAIAFLRTFSEAVAAEAPGTLLVAEESSAWPQVTRPPWVGGLGFSLRWNVGWVRDTLEYLAQDPVYRHYHHDLLTFSPMYAFQDSYVLALSHEEVEPGRGALLERMPGDPWQRQANIRLLYTYLWTHPGKKLLFMGRATGFPCPRDPAGPPDPALAGPPELAGIAALVRDLNRLYRASPALHRQELSQRGFEWVDRHDAPQSIIAYLRRGGDEVLVVALNFTPVPRQDYRIGVPLSGPYEEVLNSDSAYYGGSNLGNLGDLRAEPIPWMGRPYSVSIVLPPLAGVVLRPSGGQTTP
jgi:1,4-alpha-glucan branching enzyme